MNPHSASDNGKARNGKNRSSLNTFNGERKSSNFTRSQPSRILERQDWTAFRTIEGLIRKAGVPRNGLPQVIIKELVDNALDAAGDCEVELSDGVVIVHDAGEGLPGTDGEIAGLFSISRPQRSSKFIRMPTRGALGNGLRIVTAATLITEGELIVATRGRRLRITTDPLTGESTAERIGSYDQCGTRIELTLGHPLEPEASDLLASQIAITAARAQEKFYGGRSSPHWYDVEAFYELMLSMPAEVTVRDFVRNLDGCSSSGVSAAITDGFERRPAQSVSREDAALLLRRCKNQAREVNPKRLGRTGRKAFGCIYKHHACFANFPGGVRLPIVVEVWAEPCASEDCDAVLMVNGTVATASASATYYAKEKTTAISGSGISFNLRSGKSGLLVHINITTPFMPVVSEGKAPVMSMFRKIIEKPLQQAAKNAKMLDRLIDTDDPTEIKACIFRHMDEQIRTVSDDRKYRFHWRQVWYRLRPIVMDETGKELAYGYFSQTLVTDWEDEHPEPQSYRDPRGIFYTPHTGHTIHIGTLAVETYERPKYAYNKILFIEKDLFAALISEKFPQRHDVALMTTKGQPTRAARDLIDLIGDTDEAVQVFCLHDCDASGTLIYQALQEETRARPARKIEIINLGLDVQQVLELEATGEVQVEDIEYKERTVADYAIEHKAWFASHRCELNALRTSAFIALLDRKMTERGSGKVVPPANAIEAERDEKLRETIRERELDRILAEADIDGLVEDAIRQVAAQVRKQNRTLLDRVQAALEAKPEQSWRDAVEGLVEELVRE
jgi:hypothetical protein